MTKIYLVAGLAAVLFFGGCNSGGETQEEAPEETVEETTREETTETTVEEEDEETVVVEVEQPPPDLELDTLQPDPQSAPAAANASTKQPTSLCHQDRSQCDESLPGIQTEREMEEMWRSQQAQRPQPPAYTPEEQAENRRILAERQANWHGTGPSPWVQGQMDEAARRAAQGGG
jgi:hypothetical protein